MDKPFSLYLDLVRFVAACLVYVYHSNQRAITTDILPFSDYGHSSVIVFFVLSGFVISYVTDTKEKCWRDYSASRLSRIASVAIPAVALTLLLDTAGRQLYPEIYSGYPYDQFLLRSVAALGMGNEIWFVSITTFSNIPFWSICYEFWYYFAFALFYFLPRPYNWLSLGALAIVLGPKIVLLGPIWVAGAILYRWQAPLQWPPTRAALLAVASALAIVAFHMGNVEPLISAWFKAQIGEPLHTELTFSKFFISDYILGLLVFLNFAAMRRAATLIAPILLPLAKPIRFVASYTFTLYLLHQPLFLFWTAVLRWNPDGLGQWLAVTTLTALSVLVIGMFTEQQRHILRKWFVRALQLIPVTIQRHPSAQP